jgi:hypothetical protein
VSCGSRILRGALGDFWLGNAGDLIGGRFGFRGRIGRGVGAGLGCQCWCEVGCRRVSVQGVGGCRVSGVDGGGLLSADVWIYGDVPLLQQPFGDVDTIPVLPAPPAQLRGEGVFFSVEVQLLCLQFEFGGEDREGRHGLPPLGIAAFVSSVGDGGWSRHIPDDTPSPFTHACTITPKVCNIDQTPLDVRA